MKWQYNNPGIKTKNAYEAKILRQAHVLEKGMSLRKPKSGFGVKKALELLEYIAEYENCGFSIKESQAVLNSLGVLCAYVEFHENRGFSPNEVETKLKKYNEFIPRTGENLGLLSVIVKLCDSMHKEIFKSSFVVGILFDNFLKNLLQKMK